MYQEAGLKEELLPILNKLVEIGILGSLPLLVISFTLYILHRKEKKKIAKILLLISLGILVFSLAVIIYKSTFLFYR